MSGSLRTLLVGVAFTALAAFAGSAVAAPASQVTGRWASALSLATVTAQPAVGSRTVGTLRLQTEDGFPEVYAVYGTTIDVSGAQWIRVGLPKRPNGTTGWVPAAALGTVHSVHTRLTLDKAAKTLTLTRDGKTIWSGAAGYGAPGTPTPSGRFWVREKFRASGGSYGPYAIGTSDYSVLSDWPRGGIIGIHGTDQPALIPGRPSHGCIRLRNAAVTALYPLVPVGTPLLIR